MPTGSDERSWPVSQGELAVAAVDAAGREAGVVHLANSPDRGAGFGAAGLTSWSMAIRTGGAEQVGDAAVAGRMVGGGDRFHVYAPIPHTHGGFGADYMSKAWREAINSGGGKRRAVNANPGERPATTNLWPPKE